MYISASVVDFRGQEDFGRYFTIVSCHIPIFYRCGHPMGCTASHHILHQNHCKYLPPHTVPFWDMYYDLVDFPWRFDRKKSENFVIFQGWYFTYFDLTLIIFLEAKRRHETFQTNVSINLIHFNSFFFQTKLFSLLFHICILFWIKLSKLKYKIIK